MDENINLQQNDDNLHHSFFISLFNPEVWFKVLTHIQINYLSSKLKDVLKSIHVYILKGNSLNNMCHSVRVYQATISMLLDENNLPVCYVIIQIDSIHDVHMPHKKQSRKKNQAFNDFFFR